MRPLSLNPLFAPVTTLPGVGPRLAPLYQRLAGEKVVDLLWHLPSSVIDRRFQPKVSDAPDGSVATLILRVDAHFPPETPRRPYRVRMSDDTGFLHLVFFHAREDWLKKQLPVGAMRVVSGKVEHFGTEIQMSHPDHMVPVEHLETVCKVEPVYPLTGGLAARMVAKTVQAALERSPKLPEWQDVAWMARQGWPDWHHSLLAVHNPDGAQSLTDSPARRRLAYDELLANQLALALVRERLRRIKGRSIQGDGSLRAKVMAALPFSLTGAQSRALSEIDTDMQAETRMLRLLQGDVGSGKTVVALLACLSALEGGSQAAIMAPTEILARQHLATILPLAEAAGIHVALLTGRDKGKAREKLLAGLAKGEIQLLIGTHALFQEDVSFQDLALAVIDEQHRFGVHQRLELAAKGRAVDMLVMTATPIPRTLLLTAYGDMDSSRLDEKPPGRKPVDTRALPLSRLEDMGEALKRAISDGSQAYWVCPLVEESETSDLAAAEERFRHLSRILGDDRVGLVHGKMKAAAKDAVMEAFASGRLAVLVATTVIEVGVDVPNASVMVIEHAERFGLAQLHQLRGRVGRGSRESRCLLLYGHPLGAVAKARLEIMRATEDGFRIAEEDLRLRGGGEILGTRQSGLPEFRLADLTLHGTLLTVARDDARLILERDPDLSSPRGEALRTLLYLFERDGAVLTLRSG